MLEILGDLIGCSCYTDDLGKPLGNNESDNKRVIRSNANVNILCKDAHCLLYVLAIALEANVDIKLEGLESEFCLDYVVEEICKLLRSELSHLAGSGKITDKLLCKIVVKVKIKTAERNKLLISISVLNRDALEGKKQILDITCGDNRGERLAFYLSGSTDRNVSLDSLLDLFSAVFNISNKIFNDLRSLVLAVDIGKNGIDGFHDLLVLGDYIDNVLECFNDRISILFGTFEALGVLIRDGLETGLDSAGNICFDLVLNFFLVSIVRYVLFYRIDDRITFANVNAESCLKELLEKLLLTFADRRKEIICSELNVNSRSCILSTEHAIHYVLHSNRLNVLVELDHCSLIQTEIIPVLCADLNVQFCRQTILRSGIAYRIPFRFMIYVGLFLRIGGRRKRGNSNNTKQHDCHQKKSNHCSEFNAGSFHFLTSRIFTSQIHT